MMEHFGDEANADITTIFYVVDAVESVIRVLSDDTDMFVLLVYLGYRVGAGGGVVDINASYAELGPQCMQ